MNDLYSIKLNVGETLTASRLAPRARKTAHAKARARTEVSPNPFNTTRTNVLPPVMAKLDFVKQMLKPKKNRYPTPYKGSLCLLLASLRDINNCHISPSSKGWPPNPKILILGLQYVCEKRLYNPQYSKKFKLSLNFSRAYALPYRFAHPRMPKVAFDPLPGGYLGGLCPLNPCVFPSEVILKEKHIRLNRNAKNKYFGY